MKIKELVRLFYIRKGRKYELHTEDLKRPMNVLCAGTLILHGENLTLSQNSFLRRIHLLPGSTLILDGCKVRMTERRKREWIIGEHANVYINNSTFVNCSNMLYLEDTTHFRMTDCKIQFAGERFLDIVTSKNAEAYIDRCIFSGFLTKEESKIADEKYRSGTIVCMTGEGKNELRYTLIRESADSRRDDRFTKLFHMSNGKVVGCFFDEAKRCICGANTIEECTFMKCTSPILIRHFKKHIGDIHIVNCHMEDCVDGISKEEGNWR